MTGTTYKAGLQIWHARATALMNMDSPDDGSLADTACGLNFIRHYFIGNGQRAT